MFEEPKMREWTRIFTRRTFTRNVPWISYVQTARKSVFLLATAGSLAVETFFYISTILSGHHLFTLVLVIACFNQWSLLSLSHLGHFKKLSDWLIDTSAPPPACRRAAVSFWSLITLSTFCLVADIRWRQLMYMFSGANRLPLRVTRTAICRCCVNLRQRVGCQVSSKHDDGKYWTDSIHKSNWTRVAGFVNRRLLRLLFFCQGSTVVKLYSPISCLTEPSGRSRRACLRLDGCLRDFARCYILFSATFLTVTASLVR